MAGLVRGLIIYKIIIDIIISLCYNIHIIRKMFTGNAEKVKSIQFCIRGKAKALKRNK